MGIAVLSPTVASRIAAGEVIERPASVVKELLENALDAGARRVEVEAEEAGLKLIRVSDDGCGIPMGEVELAFERHATSKLRDVADLSRMTTLGFRGEALPSIAAAARVELATTTSSGLGLRVSLEGGQVVRRVSEGRPRGTSVAVRDLFLHLPARRRFLRSPATEAGHIAQVVGRCVLAFPEVAFSLRLDGRRVLQSPGSGHPDEAVAAVLGADVAAQLLPVRHEAPDGLRLAGYVSPPSLLRANRSSIYLFVNRRWVQSRSLTYAVEEAYRGSLPVGRYPVAVLALEVDLAEVDVNVHPTKAEVRFRREGAVFEAVRSGVRAALGGASGGASGAAGLGTARSQIAGEPSGDVQQALLWTEHVLAGGEPDAERPLAAPEPPAAAGGWAPVRRPPLLRPVGQVAATYLVAEGADGLYLVDQHAAHERVLFEGLMRAWEAGRPEVQGLLDPVPVELAPALAELLREQVGALEEVGFALEPFGSGGFLVRTVPAVVAGRPPAEGLVALLEELGGESEGLTWHERLARVLACHGAVRAGQPLSLEEMRELLRQLGEAMMPGTCPHGRPTTLHLSIARLERDFGRR